MLFWTDPVEREGGTGTGGAQDGGRPGRACVPCVESVKRCRLYGREGGPVSLSPPSAPSPPPTVPTPLRVSRAPGSYVPVTPSTLGRGTPAPCRVALRPLPLFSPLVPPGLPSRTPPFPRGPEPGGCRSPASRQPRPTKGKVVKDQTVKATSGRRVGDRERRGLKPPLVAGVGEATMVWGGGG